MRDEIKQHFDNIVDTITCADGGVKFAKLRFALDEIDKEAEAGVQAADQLLQSIRLFSRLINSISAS